MGKPLSHSGASLSLNRCRAGFILFVSAVALLLLTGCEHITEFESGTTSSLQIYSSDLELVNEIPGIENAVQFLAYPGYLFVVTSGGEILKYDSESLELLDTNIIGPASSAGYSTLCYSSGESSVYITGATGNLIEVSLPGCTVKDDFSVCEFPIAMTVSYAIPNLLYVGDGASDRLYAVRAGTNAVMASEDVLFPVNDIEGCNTDTVYICTDDFLFRAGIGASGQLEVVPLLPGEFHALAYCEWLDMYSVVVGNSLSVFGWIYDPDLGYETLDVSSNSVTVSGNGHILTNDGVRYAYVLSYMGNSVSSLVKYDMSFQEFVSQELIDGFPLAIQASGSGAVYVLVLEGS